LSLVACNQAFDLAQTQLAPEAPMDRDIDGIADGDDNCPDVANAEQSDDDDDDVGDACDNCPLVPNHNQDAIGDGDALGDICDPHPANEGDCLIVYDSFTDPAQIATGWMAAATLGTPMVEPTGGQIRLVPPAAAYVAIFALGSDGKPLTGRFDVQVRATVTGLDINDQFGTVTSGDLTTGLRCMLQLYSVTPDVPGVIAMMSPSQSYSRPLSSLPYGELTTIRMTTEDPDGSVHLQCRVDYGIALGNAQMTSTALPSTTNVGIIAHDRAVDVEGIALYRYQPGTPCPAPVIR
jgi:hypothetical protein